MSFIEITEEWVKDRVKITKEKLDDIKSLSLPGTFDEKIIDLGNALIHFTRLKELDLSRNVLENLNGLSHLNCLESLNLYYNNVASLKELYKLRNNQKLTQLDLRLNPVARNETDYRLCLIHMLPLLIRLDDRCVKDEERKASLMYFGSDQSREFSPDKSDERMMGNEKSQTRSHRKTHPRVDMINRWTKGVLDEHYLEKDSFNDEVIHLNFDDIQTSEENIAGPRDKEYRSVKEYSPRERLDVEREINQFRQSGHVSNFSTIPVYIRPDDKNVPHKTYGEKSHSDYTLYKSHLTNRAHGDGFGINILDHNKPISLPDNSSLKHQTTIDEQPNNTDRETLENLEIRSNIPNGKIDPDIPRDITNKICDLVDRYWNGSKSLHQHPKFITSINKIIVTYCAQLNTNQVSNDYLEPINRKSSERKPINSAFQSNNSLEDNNEDMKTANEALREQIRDLRQKLNVSERFIEITDLLKQSHKSLITTNEQLRKQLDNQNKRNSAKNEK